VSTDSHSSPVVTIPMGISCERDDEKKDNVHRSRQGPRPPPGNGHNVNFDRSGRRDGLLLSRLERRSFRGGHPGSKSGTDGDNRDFFRRFMLEV
jgi:hypothetical protein